MALPKDWHLDPRTTEAYTKRRIRILKRAKVHSIHWEEMIYKLRRQGLKPKEAIHYASAHFAKGMIRKAGIPNDLLWREVESSYDQDCSVCNLLFDAEVIEIPGRLRYLGTFYAGQEKVATQLYHEDGDPYVDDFSFPNYLAGYRCEVCGNEETDGY